MGGYLGELAAEWDDYRGVDAAVGDQF